MVGFLCLLVVLLSICLSEATTRRLNLFLVDRFTVFESWFRSSDPSLLVVGIDEGSLASIPHRWPWPREVFSDVVEKIQLGHPRFIVMGIVFQHPNLSDQGAGDQRLIHSIRRCGNVVLISIMEEALTEAGLEVNLRQSHELFRNAVAFDGLVKGLVSPDGIMRSFVIRDNRMGVDSCVLQLAKRLRPTLDEHLFRENFFSSGLIAYSNSGIQYPEVSAKMVLSGAVQPDVFRDKIVFIGATAPILHDMHTTPVGRRSGVQVLAQTLESLLSDRISWEIQSISSRFLMTVLAFLLVTLIILPLNERAFLKSFLGLFVSIFGFMVSTWVFRYHLPLASFIYSWVLTSGLLFTLESLAMVIYRQASQKEAQAAKAIQSSFFPKEDLLVGEYHFRCICKPCEDVGGDYCDIVPLDPNSVFFLVGDVTGHGFSAAMLTTVAKTTMELLKMQGNVTLEKYMQSLNTLLMRLGKKRILMTLAAGIIDVSSNRVELSSAGHLSAVRVDAYGQLQEVKQATFPLGAQKNLRFSKKDFEMNPGDLLILFSDGIIEAIDWDLNQYGFERWYDDLSRNLPAFRGNASFDTLLGGVLEHTKGRPFSDDVTLMVIHRTISGDPT